MKVFKLKFAACLALLVGTLTVIIGFVHDARPLTLLYRTAISLVVFGIAGYVIGSIGEKFLSRLVAVTPSDSGIHDAAMPGEPHTEQEEASSSAPFTPFTPDNLARIIKKQIE